MRSCEEFELMSNLVIDGEATLEERAELSRHLETCPACRAYFNDIKRIHETFAQDQIVVPDGFAARVMDRVRKTGQDLPEKAEEKKVIPFPHWRRWAALAACCAVAVLSLWAVRGTGGVKGDTAAVGGAPQASMDMRSAPEGHADQDGPEPLFDSKAVVDGEVTLDEAPLATPEEESAEPAKAAVRQNAEEDQPEGDGQAFDGEPDAGNLPAYTTGSEEADAILPPDGMESEEPDPVELEDHLEDAPEQGAEDPDEPEAPDLAVSAPEEGPEFSEEPEETAEAVEPAEVIGVPEPGILIAYGSAAQDWVENVLGLEWAAGGSYSLTAEQYGGLLRILEEAGEPYRIEPGEGYCLMTE